MCVHIRSLLPLPLLLPIHPLHPVTSSHTPHLSRRFASWPLTPPPRSDSFRSTVHNVQTPCRPLRTRQGEGVRGLQCLSCHMHTIRRPPAPVGPSHLRTRWCGISCIHYYVCHYNVCTYSFPPAPPPAPPHPPSSPCHIVTHTTLVTQVVSWPLTPPPCNFIHKYMPLRCVHVSGLCRPTTLERQQGPMVPIA